MVPGEIELEWPQSIIQKAAKGCGAKSWKVAWKSMYIENRDTSTFPS